MKCMHRGREIGPQNPRHKTERSLVFLLVKGAVRGHIRKLCGPKICNGFLLRFARRFVKTPSLLEINAFCGPEEGSPPRSSPPSEPRPSLLFLLLPAMSGHRQALFCLLVAWSLGWVGKKGTSGQGQASLLPFLSTIHRASPLPSCFSSLASRVSRPSLPPPSHTHNPTETTDTAPWARTRESPTNGVMPMPPGPMSVSSSRPQVRDDAASSLPPPSSSYHQALLTHLLTLKPLPFHSIPQAAV